MADPKILTDCKAALRISSTTTAFNTEITDLIAAAKADLGLSGILDEHLDDTEALVKRAIITYVKANFGWNNPEAERLQKSYEMLKNHLTLSADYAFYAITFTVTDTDTSEVIREAEVAFDGQVKTTNASGQAVFYVRAGSNYEYTVTADDYGPDDDDDNLVDVSASTAIAISLTAV